MSVRWPPPSSMHRYTHQLRSCAWWLEAFLLTFVRCVNWGRPGLKSGCCANDDDYDELIPVLSQFTVVLNFFLHRFTFCVQCLLRWPRSSSMHRYTWGKELRMMAWSVSSDICQVCELKTANLVAFYTWQRPFHATALPIDRLDLKTGLPVDSVHGEIHADYL
jgi:hypothetical protein